MCSIRCRIGKASGRLCGAPSRKVGSGCAAVPTRRASSPLQARDPLRPNERLDSLMNRILPSSATIPRTGK